MISAYGAPYAVSSVETSDASAPLRSSLPPGLAGPLTHDEATVVGRTLFLHTPDGLGRSELAAQLARAGGPLAAAGSATVRNWATVTKLLAMCQA